jgi:hypothetical protein
VCAFGAVTGLGCLALEVREPEGGVGQWESSLPHPHIAFVAWPFGAHTPFIDI